MNERLRTAMVRRGLAVAQLAETCAVDPKSVERWISLGRIPHRRHRWMVAHKLGVDETYLWPDLLLAANTSALQTARSEILETYPDRASVPREVWLRLLSEAQEHIDVLVFSGTFYAQTQPRIARMLTERLAAGAHVRLCFGEPNSRAVAIRDLEEGLGGTLGAKIRASLVYYRELAAADGCEIRLHGTTLYASVFRYDDEMIFNPHAWGAPASLNPAFHLRRLDGGTLFHHYSTSIERVWETAQPWLGETV
jgi:transcriptional regulator with XRE-family HTH domain